MIEKQIANFQILKELGAGGMGTVYKAKDLNLKRLVAVKVLHPNLLKDKNSYKRFKNEAEISAQINHPNVATLYNFIESDGQSFIIMEYVEGITLEDLIIEKGSLSKDEVIDYGTQMLSGLSAAHKLNIMHRDLKPSNIMINDHGFLKIMDFGIALQDSSTRLTTQNKIIGTFDYMAPELFSGKNSSPSSDLYAVGIMLYEMISGQPLFNADSQASLMYQILHKTPSFDLKGNKRCFKPILDKLLNKSPKKRYNNTRKAIADLEACRNKEAYRISNPLLKFSPLIENVQKRMKPKTKLYKQDNIVRVSNQQDSAAVESSISARKIILSSISAIALLLVIFLAFQYIGESSEPMDELSPQIVESGVYEPLEVNNDSRISSLPHTETETEEMANKVDDQLVKDSKIIEKDKVPAKASSPTQAEQKGSPIILSKNPSTSNSVNDNVASTLTNENKDEDLIIDQGIQIDGNVNPPIKAQEVKIIPEKISNNSSLKKDKILTLDIKKEKIALVFPQTISSNDFKLGETISLKTSENLKVNDYIIIEKGAAVIAKVVQNRKSNSGRVKFGITFDEVQAVNGEWLSLKYPEYSDISMGSVEFKKGSEVSRIPLVSTKISIKI